MGTLLVEVFRHPDELYPLLKLKRAAKNAVKQTPPQPHWGFCYTILHKVSRSFALLIQQLDTDLRDAVCIFYLVLRALDTIEDDTSIPTEVKVPTLLAFHGHVHDRDWHFSCGTEDHKVLMDQLHHVSTAFSELGNGYQKIIKDITRKMESVWKNFIILQVETTDEYDEYCHYEAGLVGLGPSKLFHASGKEDMAPEHLPSSMGVFLQKAHIIRDFLEDINETPKPRMFWPYKIWNKYVNKLEDLQYEENSVKAVECLNDMVTNQGRPVTNALTHVEDCFKYMTGLRDPVIFRFCAIPQVMDIGTLALCYNNIEVFRGAVKMRRGLSAKIIDRTNIMSDLHGAFYDFSCMLKSKINKNDPNATKTLNQINAIQKVCMDSGVVNRRKSYIIQNGPKNSSTMIVLLFVILAIIFSYLYAN
ncbi:squalene synthase-like [Pistacia vera]|uniref:squalene synthase-like n=1 Tax=Pistacia vera TaxID=55513 RepID=UPI001263BA03|nr:squalene synthase-like [Pistacia vera]